MTDNVKRSLPNAITLLRLVLAGGFFAALSIYRFPETHVLWGNLAIGMFILAVTTDAVDGYLARKWNAQSVFGRIMDPFCDKVLVLGAFIYLAGPRFVVPQWVQGGDFFTMSTGVYPWMVAVILARELLVTSIRGEVEATGQSFAAKGAGKLKMILQAAVIPIVIFVVVTFKTGDTPWAMWTCHVLIYLTVLVTVWSGVPYVIGAKRTLGGKAGTD